MSAMVLPGWYGKLPSLGDFTTRRLPSLFVEPWDRWLASSLAEWRAGDEAWLEAYLAAPPLRFALGAGVPFKESPGYAGVLMPSVDRAGRYFPLTVARPRAPEQAATSSAFLEAMEDLTVSALNDDWSADRFDTELGRLDPVDDTGPGWPAQGQTLWWFARHGELSAPVTAAGLPTAAMLVQLFSGRP